MSASTDLPPHLQARYGTGRRQVLPLLVVGVLVAALAGAVVLVGMTPRRAPIEATLLAWDDIGPDRVDITFEVRRDDQQIPHCILRAQDDRRIDVGYAVVQVPPGTTYQQVTYPLRTLAPAYVVELLGCGDGTVPERVPPPQFPAGVVPPDQPWTP